MAAAAFGGAVFAGACSSSDAPGPGGDADTTSIGEERVRIGGADDHPCTLLPTDRLAQAVGAPVRPPVALKGTFVLPGTKPFEARECLYGVEEAPDRTLRAVRVRVTDERAETVEEALDRFAAPGIARVEPSPLADAGAVVWWQPVGRTIWVRAGEKAFSIELQVTAEGERDEAVARQLAADVLTSWG